MNIELALARVISENQTVTLPGFGVFKATKTEFYIHPVENSFAPPSLKLEFIYDGKCVSEDFFTQIATDQNIEIEEARQKVEDFVKELKIQIQRGSNAKIQGIGEFYITTRKTVNFRQIEDFSLAKESFGLKAFKLSPIKKDVLDTKIPSNVEKTKKQKRNNFKKLLPYAAIFILIAGSTVIYFAFFHNNNDQKPAQQETTVVVSDQKPETKPIQVSDSIPQDTMSIDSNINNSVQSEAQNIEAKSLEKKYFIIAGCFKDETLANNLVYKLKSKGYPASLEGKTGSGLFRVCYDGYSTWDDAAKAVKEINKKEGKSLWIDKVY